MINSSEEAQKLKDGVEKLEKTMSMLNEVTTYTKRTNLTEVVHHAAAFGIVEGQTEVTQELKDETEKESKTNPK